MKILIVVKHSKYEWERLATGASHEDIVAKYTNEYADIEAILRGHDQQVRAREIFKTVFYDADCCFMPSLPSDVDKRYDLVIVLGGDNSFTKVSHHIYNTNILGVNSDPQRSSGHLLRWAASCDDDVYELRERLDFQEYSVEGWTRLGATVDGTKILSATSEYYLGEQRRDQMSRHVLEYKGNKYEQKCSGMIVATGSGSTGWFEYASGHKIEPYMVRWNPSEVRACFTITEIFEPKSDDVTIGAIYAGEELIIHSLNDSHGCISVDAWNSFGFCRGTTARIYIDQPLNVLIPKRGSR